MRPKQGQTKDDKESALDNLAQIPRRKMFGYLAYLAVGAPLFEEGLFRALPSGVAASLGAEGTAWPTGLGTSLAFAAIHRKNDKTGETTLPIEQFNLGLLTWWLQRNRGYSHAVLSHTLNNLPTTLITGAVYERNRATRKV